MGGRGRMVGILDWGIEKTPQVGEDLRGRGRLMAAEAAVGEG